jgi:hypothetical protein
MLKSISTFAALMAAGIAALPPLSPQVRARGPVPRASSDRIDTRPRGITCPQREWPYFAAPCLRDPKRPFGGAGRVRIVSIDRLPSPTDPKPR